MCKKLVVGTSSISIPFSFLYATASQNRKAVVLLRRSNTSNSLPSLRVTKVDKNNKKTRNSRSSMSNLAG